MKKETIQLQGQLSQEEIAKLKTEHPTGVVGIKTATGKIAYFRKPNWDDLNIAASELSADTPMDYTRDLMVNCFVGGCEDLIKLQDDILGASKVFAKVIDGTKAELVEL